MKDNEMIEEVNEVEVYEEVESEGGFSIGKIVGALLVGVLAFFGIRGLVKKFKNKRNNNVENNNVETNKNNK